MPFALITVGLILVITGARNTYADFGNTLRGDFTGPNNFTYWLVAFGIVGALGYIDALRTFSRMFLALILISMILANKGGVFNAITNALQSGPVNPTAAPSTVSGAANDNSSTIANVAKTAANVASFVAAIA